MYTILLLAAGAAMGQQAVDPALPVEDGRRYAVEMIIFSYVELDSVGNEIFVPELSNASSGIPEFGDTVAPAVESPADADAELRFRLLDASELTMRDTWGRLSRLQAYDPLMHFGWVQETLPDADAPELALARFSSPPAGLDGNVSLSLSRFLHLGVDLTLAATGAAAAASPPRRPAGYVDRDASDDPATGATDDPARYAPLRYELHETRIMKSGETRYFDHPHFGVIARVWRVEGPETAAADR